MEVVDTIMAVPTDMNALVEGLAAVAAAKGLAPVKLARNQVMKGQTALTAAERADADSVAGRHAFIHTRRSRRHDHPWLRRSRVAW